MPNTHATLAELFTATANAIRAKGGTTASIVADEFPSAVEGIAVSPIVVSTAAEMNEKLTAANVGKAYLFAGTTAFPYTNGDIYIVEDVGSGELLFRRYGKGAPVPKPVLNDNSWDVIRAVSDAGEAANYWSVGDCKEVVLDGTVGDLTFSNFTTYAFILGFNHNADLEGSNRIHFQFGKTALSGGADICFTDNKYLDSVTPETGYFSMNSSNTNSGGWEASQMRTTICPAFKSALPAELQSVLKSVTKYTYNEGAGASLEDPITATTDEIFLLAEFEVFGSHTSANLDEKSKQLQYDYYKAGNSKIKYNHSSTGSAVYWWLRSPMASFSTGFVGVNRFGSVSTNSASNSNGVAPGFCV